MFDGLIRRIRRSRRLGALLPMAAALALVISSTAAQGAPRKPKPPPPPPPPTVLAVNGKCPAGYVLLNPKSPVAQRICGRKVG